MKAKRAILALMIGATAACASAQADYRLGFCDNSQTIGDRRIDLPQDGEGFDAAICLTGKELAKVADGEFTGVNVGINTTFNVQSITGWIRTDLDGEDLAAGAVTKGGSPDIHKGWNSVLFDTPLKIEPDRNYYVGYTLRLTRTSPICYIASQGDMTHEGGCWTRTAATGWTDSSETYGTLFLEALIHSDSLPQNDLALTGASFDHDVYSQGSEIGLDYQVYNTGMLTVTEFDLTLACEEAGVSITRKISCNLPYNERARLTELYVLPPMEIDRSFAFTVSIDRVNNEPDENPADNSIVLPEIPSIDRLFERTTVLEEFTTEWCPNCPNAANHVRYMLNSLTEEELARTAVLCHHSGFQTDVFTKQCDNDYLRFYRGLFADNRIFAPAFMIDRVPQGVAPVFQLVNFQDLARRVRGRLAEPAYYSVMATGTHDPDKRKVSINVTGKAHREKCADPRVTVYLTENDVQSIRQKGADDTFKHQHLIRAYNGSWGASPEWTDGGEYYYECSLVYPEECNPENMNVLVIISNYDADNDSNCQIENAYTVSLPKLMVSSGIKEAENADIRIFRRGNDICAGDGCGDLEVYDTSGRRVSPTGLPSGVYVARATSAAGSRTAKVTIP